jgi:hypothetical protein
MKKLILIPCLLIVTFISSYGQWYVKKYNIQDINLLSLEKLDESLTESRQNLLISGIATGSGGLLFIVFKFLRPGMSDDPGWIEELLGDEGVNNIGMVAGAGIFAGGAIASIVYMGRIGSIKTAIRKNYPSLGSVNISPALLLNNYTKQFSPGLRLTYIF